MARRWLIMPKSMTGPSRQPCCWRHWCAPPAGCGQERVTFYWDTLVDSVPRKFAANSSDQVFLEFLQRDPLQSQRISLRWVGALRYWLRDLQQHDLGVGPALIMQGDADATVDWRYNVGAIQTMFPGSRTAYLRGAGHQLANESAAFQQDYLASVERWLKNFGITLADG